jgi:hypothetical protein
MGWIVGLLAFVIFLVFLFRAPKQTIGCLAVIVIIVAVAWYALVTKPAQDRERLEEQVLVTVVYDEEKCSKDYPLAVSIHNKSNKTVTRVEWDFNAYRSGFSTNLAGYQKYSSDRILRPGESWSVCYRLPQELLKKGLDFSKLQYTIEFKSVYTQS